MSDQLDILELTPASDKSKDTQARKVAETACVVEQSLVRRDMARMSRWNSEPALTDNNLFKPFPRARSMSLLVADFIGNANVELWNSGTSFESNSHANQNMGLNMNTDHQVEAVKCLEPQPMGEKAITSDSHGEDDKNKDGAREEIIATSQPYCVDNITDNQVEAVENLELQLIGNDGIGIESEGGD